MIQNKYRYVITNRLGFLQVQPLGESDFQIEWERQDEIKLAYDKNLPSKIKFRGEAYDNLLKLEKSIYRCDYISISIERRCNATSTETWLSWFSGRFSLADGDWNLDKCEVILELDEVKAEQCIEDNIGEEVNLFDLVPTRVNVLLQPPNVTIEKVTYSFSGSSGGGPGVPNPCGPGPYWNPSSPFGDDPFAAQFSDYYQLYRYDPILETCTKTTRWARQVTTVPCGSPSPGPDWVLVDDDCPGGEMKYARPITKYGCEWTYPDTGEQGFTYDCKIAGDANGVVSLDNGMTLKNCLTSLLNKFCPGLTPVSNFFQINPTIATTINYVTGTTSKTNNIVVYQKSDIKRPTATGTATKCMASMEDIIVALCEMYNCRWRVVGNNFVIEHVSFFNSDIGLDLTIDPKYAPFIRGKRRYTYANEDIPKQEEFTFMEATTGDFKGVPIIYSGGCVGKSSKNNIKQHTVENVTTDVELCLGNPSPDSNLVQDDGMVFIACESNGTALWIINESAILDPVPRINNSMAWAQLHRDYHRYYRPLKAGNMNGVDTVFYSVKPTKKGETIKIPLCCNDVFNPDNYVVTALGQGLVSKANFSFRDETLELELLYPADEGLVGNRPPVAKNDVAQAYTGADRIINVLANDTDPDPGTFITSVQIVNPPAHGVAEVLLDKTIRYRSTTGYVGDDYITYRIFDNWNEPSNNALIAINVTPTNTPPVANDDNYIMNMGATLSVPTPGVFANDSDDIGFTLDSFDAVSTNGGAVSLLANGSFTYTPVSPSWFGTDTFTYTIIDGLGLTDTATVTIVVRNPDYPIANNDSYSTRQGVVLSVPALSGVLANDTTSIGTLSALPASSTTTAGGSVVLLSNGSFNYTPPAGYSGLDSFNYTVTNGTGTDSATVNIRVFPNIFVKMQRINSSTTPITISCSGFATAGGYFRTATWRIFFYSNSAGTIPLDVTGLGLTVNITESGIYCYGCSATSDTYPIYEEIAGTFYDFNEGGSYQSESRNCDGEIIGYTNINFVLAPGLYTII